MIKSGGGSETKTAEIAKSTQMFTPMLPPESISFCHAELEKWHNERRQYEDAMRSLCKLRWNITEEDVTNEKGWSQISNIIATVKHTTLPDIEALIKEELNMNLSERDVSKRVHQIFQSML
ncbi:hypothetical protein PHYPSEUDO_012481 [Phytophthora pseudosyringae]|uniref:Uncharacterized protein n=1 Tax=Phytophthora pseudosyringae TaxID=221518 RepID=A0A8T1WIS6_9STRA|nr:hypothetical protein PHYPSEUDO_012481 [Phytophthora pseudosyringae]